MGTGAASIYLIWLDMYEIYTAAHSCEHPASSGTAVHEVFLPIYQHKF